MKLNINNYLDIIKLRFSKTRLGQSEYKFYGLNDNQLFNYKKMAEFVGWRYAKILDRQLNVDNWRIFANDKLIFYSMMEAANLNYPKIKAVYCKQDRYIKDCIRLTQNSAGNYLRNTLRYPAFIKPVHGTYGRGAFSALSYNEATDSILMGNLDQISIDEVLAQFDEKWAEGYLIQKMLEPHPEIYNLVGNLVSSLRIIVLHTRNGPILFRGVWKFPTGNNMSDNFMHGETGNLIADIDLKAGKISKVITGTGASLKEVVNHPDTNKRLSDQAIPLWEEVKELCLTGASLFPGLKLQHWDIALCPAGPVALEVNVEGSLDLHQLAGRRGIYDSILQDNIP